MMLMVTCVRSLRLPSIYKFNFFKRLYLKNVAFKCGEITIKRQPQVKTHLQIIFTLFYK